MRAYLSGVIFCALVCPAAAQTMDELYAKAKTEGALVFYSGGPVAPYEKFVAEFQKRFPGVNVSFTGGFSNVLNDNINAQLKAGTLEVDMAFLQTAQDFVEWKKRGALLNYNIQGADKIAPVFREADGAFTTVKVNAITYAVNTKMVAAQDIPRSALDFLKPQFAGKLITCYPADDDATMFLFYTIVQKYGWSYMDKYMANKPNFVQGHLGVARSVAAGTDLVTLDATSTVTSLKQQGAPVSLVVPADDVMPLFTVTAGIFKQAPHPNAAKLFLSWFMDPAQQSRIGVFSARTDVPPPEGFKPLGEYKIDAGYKEFVSDEKLMDELRKKFEAITGPIVNKGGVK